MSDSMKNVIYKDAYMAVTEHSEEDEKVAVWVGRPPEEGTPHVVDARVLQRALSRFTEDR